MTQEASLTDTTVETTEVQQEVTKNPTQAEVSTEPKTYTQEQVDAIASKIRKTEEAKVYNEMNCLAEMTMERILDAYMGK